MDLKTLLAFSIESALNAYLHMDLEAAAGMERIAGQVIGFEVTGLNFTLFCLPAADSVQVLAEYEGEPNALIKGSPIAFTLIGFMGDSRRIITQGSVEIDGDVELGKTFYELLQTVDIDWEETLARRIGDIPAHQIGRIARSVGAWAKRTREALRMDLTEYLQEEAQVLPTRLEIEAFMDDVDILRSDVDRLAARVDRLAVSLIKNKSDNVERELLKKQPNND